MERPEVVVVADQTALAVAVADRFAGCAQDAIAARGRFNVALAGGSTPKAAYALLAAEPYRTAIAWDAVRFFFSDERCVPPSDAESNYRMAHEAMLESLGIAQAHIFRMRGEDEPHAAAAVYAQLLQAELGEGVVLDLMMLGMGPDGHTASLFPGSSPLDEDERLVRAPYVEQFASFRLTLTPRVINAARAVQIATAGTAKSAALTRALEGPYDPTACPVQIVRPTNGRLTWLVDSAAARLLPHSAR